MSASHKLNYLVAQSSAFNRHSSVVAGSDSVHFCYCASCSLFPFTYALLQSEGRKMFILVGGTLDAD